VGRVTALHPLFETKGPSETFTAQEAVLYSTMQFDRPQLGVRQLVMIALSSSLDTSLGHSAGRECCGQNIVPVFGMNF
jgi:hypothetical protein